MQLSNGLVITRSMTTPTRRSKKPRPVWLVSGPSVGAYEQVLYELGGRPYRGTFSFFEDPTRQVAALNELDRLSFRQRQELDQLLAAERAALLK